MIIFYIIACVLFVLLILILFINKDIKKVDSVWLIIDDLDKRISDGVTKKDLMLIKAEIYKNYIKDGMIQCRLPSQIKRLLYRIDDRLDLIGKL